MLQENSSQARKIALMGVLAAISIICVLCIRIPFPPAPYLVYDMADVPILIGSFILGPLAGLEVLVVVSAIQAFFLGGNNIIGFIMHVCASGVLIMVASFIYAKLGRSLKSMVFGLVLGSIAMALVMIPMNLIFTVRFFGVPRDAVVKALIPVTIPFNLLKAGANSILSFALYKSIYYVIGRKNTSMAVKSRP